MLDDVFRFFPPGERFQHSEPATQCAFLLSVNGYVRIRHLD
jgi:hypothetical protein